MKVVGSINFDGASKAAREASLEGLLVGGELVLGDSNEQVPHEEGDLERTGAVSGEMDAKGPKVAISYRDVAYRGQAVQQHEDMTLKHDSGRNAKFLERALAANRDRVREAVAGALRKRFGG